MDTIAPSREQRDTEETQPTRDQIRSRRHREVRPRTINMNRVPKVELLVERARYPQEEIEANQAERPKTRGECKDGLRPCPWVGCRHHLYLHDSHGGTSITINFPDLEPGQMTESCSLDVADQGKATQRDVARLINATRERVRQIEKKILPVVQSVFSRTVEGDEE